MVDRITCCLELGGEGICQDGIVFCEQQLHPFSLKDSRTITTAFFNRKLARV
jgi:hypothetical protein